MIRAGAVDAVVTGIRVSGSFDGVELVRRLRASAETRQTPIVVLTACALDGDRQRAYSAGCDVFIPKPCPPDQLLTELRSLLSGRGLPTPEPASAQA